ncbi:MAG TPA: MerR family transcriptional regulator [Blastocatellia bacterium]
MKPMAKKISRWYKAAEFAGLAGVTVRTLHHYDRLGLLKPSGRTAKGYRLYGERDFARLQQIVTLKFIGFPLKQIKSILDRGPQDLGAELRRQREVIAEQRNRLELAIKAIEKVERVLASTDEPDWEVFAEIIEVINMQHDMSWTDKYYSEEAKQKIAERARTVPRAAIEQAEREWPLLIKEVEASLGEDPTSEKAQALAERWVNLVRGFTGGDPEIQRGLNKMYADKQNWPATMPKPFSDEVQAFIQKAIAIRKQNAGS